MPNEVVIHVRGKDDASAIIGGVKKSATGLGSALGDVAKIAGGFILAQGLMKLPGLLTSGISAAQNLAGSISKLGRETGLTAEESSKLIFAFEHYGLSSDDASRSLGILAKKLKGVQDEETGVATGGKSMIAILGDLGIKSVDAAGNLAPMSVLLPQIADVVKGMPDGLAKTGLMMQLFGRSGKDLIPILNQGSEGLKALGLDAERLGVVMDQKAVQAAKNLTYAQRDLHEAVKGLQVSIGEALVPAMTALATGATNALVAVRPLVEEGLQKIGDFLTAHEEDIRNFGQALLDLGEQGFQRLIELGPSVLSILTNLATTIQDVAVNLVPVLAGALGDVAGLLQGHPALVYAIIAAWASFQIGTFVQDLVGLATGLFGIATASGVATGSLVTLRAALFTTGIGALIVGLATAAYLVYTNWSSIWPTLAGMVETWYARIAPLINAAIGVINALGFSIGKLPETIGLYDSAAAFAELGKHAGESLEDFKAWAKVADESTKGTAESIVESADYVRLYGQAAGNTFREVEHQMGKNIGVTKDLTGATEGLVPPVLDLGAGYQAAAGGADEATAALKASIKAALEAATAYQILVGSTLLYKLETGAATVAEAEMTNTLLSGLGVHVERQNLIKTEIGTLEDFCKAEEKAGRGEGIAAQAAQATIEKLQAEADALDIVTDRWILFGEKGLSPIGAAINEITDAIGRQTSGLSSLMGVETQEEADLIARIANYDAQIAGLEAVTAATEALTQAEQDRLGVARSRSASGNAEIEQIEDYMSIITEMERRKRENGRLTQKEQQAYADALRKLNALEKEQWTISNVHEKAQERIWDLRQETESSDETASSLEALAKKRTDEGKAAIDALEAERDPLQKALAAINAKKDAEEKSLEAKVKGRPTMEDWTRLLVGEALAQGLITTGILDQIPALAAWAKEHGQDCFNIAKGLQLLEIEQDDFLRANQADVDAWANSWALAAAAVLANMASVGSAESPGISSAAGGTADVIARGMQWGGIVTRPTLALLGEHGTEAVIPLGRGGISASTTNVYVTVMGSIRSERDLEKVIADALRHGKFRGLVTV